MFYETEMERREEIAKTPIFRLYNQLMGILRVQITYCMKEDAYKALNHLQDIYAEWWANKGIMLLDELDTSNARIVLDESNLGLYLERSINNCIKETVIPEVKRIMSEINWTQRLKDKDIPANLKTSDIVTLAGPCNPIDGSPLTNDWVNAWLGRPTGAEYGDSTSVTEEDPDYAPDYAPLEDGGEPEDTDTPDEETSEDTEESEEDPG